MPRQTPEPYDASVPPHSPSPRNTAPRIPLPLAPQSRPGRSFDPTVTKLNYGQPKPHTPQPSSRSSSPVKKRTLRRKLKIAFRLLLTIFIVFLSAAVGLSIYVENSIHRISALRNYDNRVADTPGTNWLLVGSDSRAGLSRKAKAELATGDAEGTRTDTIMLVHIPEDGATTLVSIPRDLYLDVPGYGNHKINAAYNFGGAALLAQTIETNTKIRIDHFAEIGFGGFDHVVDAVGGVHLCLRRSMFDPKAGIRLKKGCQNLSGAKALGFVRSRNFATADLERVKNQRLFLSALTDKITSVSTLLNPFRLWPLIKAGTAALRIDDDDHIWNLLQLGWALRSPSTTTVPTGGSVYTNDGDSLAWDSTTTDFFRYLEKDKPIPQNLINPD